MTVLIATGAPVVRVPVKISASLKETALAIVPHVMVFYRNKRLEF